MKEGMEISGGPSAVFIRYMKIGPVCRGAFQSGKKRTKRTVWSISYSVPICICNIGDDDNHKAGMRADVCMYVRRQCGTYMYIERMYVGT